MCDKIICWLLRSVKVSAEDVDKAVKSVDKDNDGFYSLGEIIEAVLKLIEKN